MLQCQSEVYVLGIHSQISCILFEEEVLGILCLISSNSPVHVCFAITGNQEQPFIKLLNYHNPVILPKMNKWDLDENRKCMVVYLKKIIRY